MCLERFGRATKLRSHARKKSFLNEQGNDNRLLLIFSLMMLDFFVVERDPYSRIGVKFKTKYSTKGICLVD